MSKKGDLSLSVNAIVVFVLAFAMLGVGLFLVQLIKGQAGDVTEKAFDIELLDEKPDATRPIIFPGTLRLSPGGEEQLKAGFYNTETDIGDESYPAIMNCRAGGKNKDATLTDYCTADPDDENEVNCYPEITGSVGTLGRAKGVGFNLIIKDQGNLRSGTTYVCDFAIIDPENKDTTSYPDGVIKKIQFFLEMGK